MSRSVCRSGCIRIRGVEKDGEGQVEVEREVEEKEIKKTHVRHADDVR